MKRFFAVIMSLQLILMPVAFAQGSGDQYRSNSAGGASVVSYAKQVLSLGIGVIGSNIITACPLGAIQPSLLVFMGGSLVMIGSEIAFGKKGSALKDKKTKDILMLEEKMKTDDEFVGQMQKETLELALKEEKETLKFVKQRANWTTAIGVIYLAAMIVAIIELAASKTPAAAVKTDEAACNAGSGLITNELLSMAVVMAWGWASGKAGGGGEVSQYGGFLMALPPVTKALNTTVTAYSNGAGRAITFGVSAGLTGWVAADLYSKVPKLNENIALMEKQIKKFKEQTKPEDEIVTDPDAEDSGGASGGSSGGGPGKGKIKGLASGNLARSCFSKTSKGIENSEAGCSNPLKLAPTKWSSNINIPVLSSVANLTTDLANAVSRGDMESGEMMAGQLAAMASQVKDLKKKVLDDYNKVMKANGHKELDIDKEVGLLTAQLEAQASKAGLPSTAAVADGSSSSSNDKEKIQVAAVAPISAPSITQPETTPSFTDEGTTENLDGLADTSGSTNSLSDFESTEQDISKKSDVSIFRQLSNRYFLNYTKIFERKKAPEPVPEAAPVKN